MRGRDVGRRVDRGRDVDIDIAKSIGIISVVVGHLVSGFPSSAAFLFHMPFFFIISGYLHKVEAQELVFLKKKIISLLVPYFSYLFILRLPAILSLFAQFFRNPSESSITSLFNLFWRSFYGGQLLAGTFGVFWFVTCLFLTQQTFNLIRKRLSNSWTLFIAFLLYSAAALNQSTDYSKLAFPWAVNVVLCSFLFYSIGSIYGELILKHSNNFISMASLAISTIALSLVFSGRTDFIFDMKNANYGVFFISPLFALAIAKSLCVLFRYLCQNNLLTIVLSFVGQASITIMFLHQFFYLKLPGLTSNFPWLMTVILIILCCILHKLFSKNPWSRGFLLGSRQDLEMLTLRWRGRFRRSN